MKGIDIKSYTYDGDTPASIRQKVRKAGHIVITNPDMLHSAILTPSYKMGQVYLKISNISLLMNFILSRGIW